MARSGRIPGAVSVLFLLAILGFEDRTDAQELYFPAADSAWETVSPANLEWDSAALGQALDYARNEKSSAIVILQNGRLAAEKYWTVAEPSPAYTRMTHGAAKSGGVREDIASAQKSVTSFLCGVAWGKGLLDLNKPVKDYLGAGWSKATPDQEAKITVRHLMTMTSGLDTGLRFDAPAGTKWMYNTNAYAVTTKVLEAAVHKSINEMSEDWLTKPSGMTESRWEERKWLAGGEDANKIGFVTSARDLARFGLVMLASGHWKEKDLLQNPDYLKQALSPSQDLNAAYGLFWWLNGQAFHLQGQRQVRGSANREAPDDMFMAAGALDRRVYVVPSLKLVVVRLGDKPGARFDVEFWAKLSKAVRK